MAEPFLSELRLFSFDFPPKGWSFCNGALLPINQNQALFALLGTTYGGNGQTNFALPNLQGRTPIHTGAGFTLGAAGGEESHVLTSSETPTHTHSVNASTLDGSTNAPAGNLLAVAANVYSAATGVGLTSLPPATIGTFGGSQAHTNMQPYLTLNWCIALQGIFPSPN